MTPDERTSHLDGARKIRRGEELDAARLEAYLGAALPDLTGPVTVSQFRSGHSNLTYLVRRGEIEMVLRRPPFGAQKIKTAHDMGREFRILSGLQGALPKCPRALAFCDDEDVLGAPFYLMERVSGVILRGARPPRRLGLYSDLMRELSTALIDTLAELHAVDLGATGLVHEGRPEGYVKRQVVGWIRRYENARTDDIDSVQRVAVWLGRNMPPDGGAALIHGDFKYDNLVLAPRDLSRIDAILDWEMATVGDPLMDLGLTLAYWIDPDDMPEHRLLPLGPSLLPGNLSRRQLVRRYAETSGRDLPDMLFYYVFGLFKIAVIAQQIYRRFKDGSTSDPRFLIMIIGVNVLGRAAARAIDRGRIHGLGKT